MEENKYRIHFRIATDISANTDKYLTLFTGFAKAKIPDFKYTICGQHTQYCQFPHIHLNVLTEKPCIKSLRHHWLSYLKKNNPDASDQPTGNKMVISWKKIEYKKFENTEQNVIRDNVPDEEDLRKKMTYPELVDYVMGYPLKERKPLYKFINGYTDLKVEEMMKIASAGWEVIKKAKDRKAEQEKKAVTERELMYEYIGKNLQVTAVNKFKNFKLAPSFSGTDGELNDIMDKFEEQEEQLNFRQLHKRTKLCIIDFYDAYDHTKNPNQNNLKMKSLRYLRHKKLITSEEYLDILDNYK